MRLYVKRNRYKDLLFVFEHCNITDFDINRELYMMNTVNSAAWPAYDLMVYFLHIAP